MDWSKAAIAGFVAGVVRAIYDYGMYCLIMRGTYHAHEEVFRQQANYVFYPIIEILIAVAAGLFFARSYSAWKPGVKGGLTFGFWIGIITFFTTFFIPLVFKGFPYFLTWCWASIGFIGWLLFGAVVATIYKERGTQLP